jgi:hypothetical protein
LDTKGEEGLVGPYVRRCGSEVGSVAGGRRSGDVDDGLWIRDRSRNRYGVSRTGRESRIGVRCIGFFGSLRDSNAP